MRGGVLGGVFHPDRAGLYVPDAAREARERRNAGVKPHATWGDDAMVDDTAVVPPPRVRKPKRRPGVKTRGRGGGWASLFSCFAASDGRSWRHP